MADRRSERSKKQIKRAFLDLLKEKPLAKISVSEIAEQADIGRGTFYLHYTDVYDLYGRLEDQLVNILMDIFDRSVPDSAFSDYNTMMKDVLSYLNENRENLTAFFAPENPGGLIPKIQDAFLKKMMTEYPQFYQSEYDYVEGTFLIAGTMRVIEAYFNDPKLHSEEAGIYLDRILGKFSDGGR